MRAGSHPHQVAIAGRPRRILILIRINLSRDLGLTHIKAVETHGLICSFLSSRGWRAGQKGLSSAHLQEHGCIMAGPAYKWPSNVIPLPRAAMPSSFEITADARTLELIRQLRVLLRECRLKPRSDFDHACSLIAIDKNTTTERYAAAFFQGLQVFALQPLRFFPCKAETVSNDEMWLARLLIALKTEDYTSGKYLMALRVEPKGHRRLLFLAERLAGILCSASAYQARSGVGARSGN